MGDRSSIEWTDATWNPVVGCTKVSEGCRNCYAERLAPKMRVDFSTVTLKPERLAQPLHWKKPRRIFVNSLSDLFHSDVPNQFIARVWCTMIEAPQHHYQILTKRPERMLAWSTHYRYLTAGDRRSHIWLGVSVEDQATADERIPLLLQTPAAVRFVSAEPLLGPIELRPFMGMLPHFKTPMSAYTGEPCGPTTQGWIRSYNVRTRVEIPSPLHWVIVGGESGPKARPCDLAWIRNIVKQCKQASVRCFVKQLGARPVEEGLDFDSVDGRGRAFRDRKGGDPTEWPEDLRVREFPTT